MEIPHGSGAKDGWREKLLLVSGESFYLLWNRIKCGSYHYVKLNSSEHSINQRGKQYLYIYFVESKYSHYLVVYEETLISLWKRINSLKGSVERYKGQTSLDCLSNVDGTLWSIERWRILCTMEGRSMGGRQSWSMGGRHNSSMGNRRYCTTWFHSGQRAQYERINTLHNTRWTVEGFLVFEIRLIRAEAALIMWCLLVEVSVKETAKICYVFS